MNFRELVDKSRELRKCVNHLYIYGAGLFGKDISQILSRNGVKVDGFLETECKVPRIVWGLPVGQLEDVLSENVGIIIGMNVYNTQDAIQNLMNRSFPLDRVIDGGAYYTEDKMSRLLQDNPVLEINTVVGCKVNCKYCPQDLFIQSYFAKDKTRKRVMQLDDFRLILENTPDNCVIDFAGMSEPFLNSNCTEMIRMACEAGRTVLLYTTFVGATNQDIEAVLKLPIYAITLHCADKMGYAHIPIDDMYYKRMEQILKARKEDGNPLVIGVSAQTEPPKEMVELCRGKHEIKYSLHDRVGVLKDKNLASVREPHKGKFECSLCGPQCNSHVVCPDGTVVLCDNDYAMQHVLGNIYEQSFDELQKGEVVQRVLRGMQGDTSIDLICRRCVCTHALE